jgi:hypothetical protein
MAMEQRNHPLALNRIITHKIINIVKGTTLEKTLTALQAVLFICWMKPDTPITIYMIGDSTMANEQVKAYPETGWECQ